MLSRFFAQKELQLNQSKHKEVPPQNHFAILTYGNQFKPVHYLVRHEALLPSQGDDFHFDLSDFGNDHFSTRSNDTGENIIIKPLKSFSVEAVKTFESLYEKPTEKNTKTLLQHSAILDDTEITDKDNPNEKKDNYSFSPDLSLNINPSTSEKCNDYENENLQQQKIHETYPSVIKQSLTNLFFVPSFFNDTFKFNDNFTSWYSIEYWKNTGISKKKFCSEDCV